jgi:predicted nuclease with TOPRIM domain
MSDESRFDRLEEKIDRLSEAVVSLARMEERMVTLFNRMDKHDKAVDRLATRVDELEDISAGRGHFIRFFERIFWIIFTAGIGALFWIFRA